LDEVAQPKTERTEPASVSTAANVLPVHDVGGPPVRRSGVDRPVFVYALGRIEPQFPTLAIEKEFAQATGRRDLAGLTDREAVRELLADPMNRYLARQLCWVFTIEGIETYIIHPRDPQDLTLFVEAVRPNPRATDVDVIIGVRGSIAPADVCNGLMVPIVVVDQLYSFDVDGLLDSIPRPDSIDADRYGAASDEMFHRIQQIADNAGATDEHRALNYLAVRYSGIYERAARSFGENMSLDSVDVHPSALGANRRIVDVVFTYQHRQTTAIERYAVSVDVTEEFPFLVRPLGPYFSR
jgi:PatG Domain